MLLFKKKEGIILAKKSKIEKQKKLEFQVAKYAEKRKELIAKHDYESLSKLPRNASPTRLHNRDFLDGRPHAYMRKFGMSRIRFRELALKGQIPGVRKASW